MRKFAMLLAALGLFFAAPAQADVEDGLFGLNGVLTCPLDPVLGLIMGDSDVLPDFGVASHVTNRLVGVVTGTLFGVVRLTTGTVDILTFPVTNFVGGPYSPDARVAVPFLAGEE